MRSLSIIGAGKAASSIARLFQDKKLVRVRQILNSDISSAERAADFIGAGTPAGSFSDLTSADMWLIGTSDQAIETAVEQLSAMNIVASGNVAFHLSGILPSTILSPLKKNGASIASIHPAFSFADPTLAIKDYSNVFCGMEGDSGTTDQLSPLFAAIGSIPYLIDAAQKSLYHSGMIFAANYVVTLLNAAEQIFVAVGADRNTANKIACSFAGQLAKNVQTLGAKAALTGPIKRGDTATLKKHEEALAQFDPELEKLYKQLAVITKRDLT